MNEVKNSKRPHELRVFLSHSEFVDDVAFARKIRNLLVRRLNARVFTAEELSAGEKWEVKLRNELERADVVVALLTPSSVTSSWVLHEIGAAWALQKSIIPVITRRDVLSSMPVPLQGTRALEFKDVDSPERANEFVQGFEDTLAAAHVI